MTTQSPFFVWTQVVVRVVFLCVSTALLALVVFIAETQGRADPSQVYRTVLVAAALSIVDDVIGIGSLLHRMSWTLLVVVFDCAVIPLSVAGLAALASHVAADKQKDELGQQNLLQRRAFMQQLTWLTLDVAALSLTAILMVQRIVSLCFCCLRRCGFTGRRYTLPGTTAVGT